MDQYVKRNEWNPLLRTHMSAGDAAEYIGCSKESIKNWITNGILKCVRLPINSRGDLMRFIPREEVEKQKISYSEWKSKNNSNKGDL